MILKQLFLQQQAYDAVEITIFVPLLLIVKYKRQIWLAINILARIETTSIHLFSHCQQKLSTFSSRKHSFATTAVNKQRFNKDSIFYSHRDWKKQLKTEINNSVVPSCFGLFPNSEISIFQKFKKLKHQLHLIL